jgi:hypothetical protein
MTVKMAISLERTVSCGFSPFQGRTSRASTLARGGRNHPEVAPIVRTMFSILSGTLDGHASVFIAGSIAKYASFWVLSDRLE